MMPTTAVMFTPKWAIFRRKTGLIFEHRYDIGGFVSIFGQNDQFTAGYKVTEVFLRHASIDARAVGKVIDRNIRAVFAVIPVKHLLRNHEEEGVAAPFENRVVTDCHKRGYAHGLVSFGLLGDKRPVSILPAMLLTEEEPGAYQLRESPLDF